MLKKKNVYNQICPKLIFLAFFLSFFCLSCESEKLKLSTEFVEFNTNIKFTGYQIDPTAKAATESLFYRGGNLLAQLNQVLDPSLAGSEVEKINSNAFTQAMPLSSLLQSLLNKSNQIHVLTDSAFDVSVYPLFEKWGFNIGNTPVVPDSGIIAKLKNSVTSRNVILKKDSIRFLTSQVKIGLGAIAKGWAADSVAAFFKINGFNDFIIAAAGDIVVNSSTKKTIAVKNPRDESLFLDTVYIDYGAISTSGDYERFFEQNGKRYCHIINPRTGYPDSDCLSVTVITDKGWKSDALATGIFVMGKQKGEVFLRKHNISGIISYLSAQNTVERLEINLEKYKQKPNI